jgi:2'-5' RNA ligase
MDPYSSLTNGYHVFFEPKGEINEQLEAVIRNLSAEYGGPVFQPHVTLLAMIPEDDENLLVEKTKRLATKISPFNLTFEQLCAEDRYFRALYAKAIVSEELSSSRALVLEEFGMEEVGEYMPHLSLLYGNYDASRKLETIESLKRLLPLSFNVDAVTLWKTPGDATTWTRVGEYKLRGNSK